MGRMCVNLVMNINSGNVCCSTIHAVDCSALHRACNFSCPFLFSPEAARNSGDAWPCSVVIVEHYIQSRGWLCQTRWKVTMEVTTTIIPATLLQPSR